MKTNNLKRRQRPSQPRLAVGTLPAILTLSRLPLAAILAAVLFLVAVGPTNVAAQTAVTLNVPASLDEPESGTLELDLRATVSGPAAVTDRTMKIAWVAGQATNPDFDFCVVDGTCQVFGPLELSLPAGDTRTESATLKVNSDNSVEGEERFCLWAGLSTETTPTLTRDDCRDGNLPDGWRSVAIQDRDRTTVRMVLEEGRFTYLAGAVTVDEGASHYRICTEYAVDSVQPPTTITFEYSPADDGLVSGLSDENRHTVDIGPLQRRRCYEVTFTHRRDDLRDRQAVFRITGVTRTADGQPFPNIVIGDGLTVNIDNIDESVRTAAIGEDPYEIKLKFNQPLHSRHEHWQGWAEIAVTVDGVPRHHPVVARLDCGPAREPVCDVMHIEVGTPIFPGQAVTVSYTGGTLRHRDGEPVKFTGLSVTNGSGATKPRLKIRRIGSGDVAEGGVATYEIHVESGSSGTTFAPRPDTPPGITSYRDYGIPVNIDFVWNDGTRTSSGNPASVEMFLTGNNTTYPDSYSWWFRETIPDNGSHCDGPLKMDLVEHEGDWYTINATSGTTGEITIVDGGDTHSCGTSRGGTALPVVTVSASRASVGEGSPVEVTLTRTGGGEAVTVGLSVSETGEMLGAAVSQVPLAEDQASATFSLPTVDDDTAEENSVVTVEIVPDAERYAVGESSSVAVTVQDDDGAALTAAFAAVPESHDGDSPFTFELRFSEEPKLGYKRLRDHAFAVTGGTVKKAERLEKGSNLRYEIAVEPNGDGAVTVLLPATEDCDADGAICAEDGRMLSNRSEATVAGPVEEEEEQPENSPATGAPAITGTAQVGETLTADTSDIADEDGLESASFSYQWLAGDGGTDSEIDGATGSTHTVTADDVGKTIRVRVSFTDDRGHRESLSSAPTASVAGLPPLPLTASVENAPASHDGENAFTFELRFSEEPRLGYKKLRDHAFTVTGGTVKKAERLEKGSNTGWRITVRPDGNGDVTVVLPVTSDCDAQGAICTADGRMLSNRNELSVSGPEG